MSLDHEARIAHLENVVMRQSQTLAHMALRLERIDIAAHTGGKTQAPAPSPFPEVTDDARTFDEWSAAGFSIIKGQKSTLLADNRRVFYSSQVRVFTPRIHTPPDEQAPAAEPVEAEDVPPDFFTPGD